MGDLDARVGNNNTSGEEVMGKFDIGVLNDNRERLCDFCSAKWFVKTGTIFPQDIHKLTWRSPDWRTVNQIDRFLVNRNMRISILDTGVMKRANVNSDHYLVKTRIRLELVRTEGRMNVRERFHVSKLQSEVQH